MEKQLQNAIKLGGQPLPTNAFKTMTTYFSIVAFLIMIGGMPTNPTFDQWWEIMEVPFGSPPERYSDLHDKAYFSMDIGDFLCGSIFMICKDIVGNGVTIFCIGISLAFAWSTYLINYGAIVTQEFASQVAINEFLFQFSMCIQGSVLNGISICLLQFAGVQTFPEWFPRQGPRFMVLNTSFDMAPFLGGIFIYLASPNRKDVAQAEALLLIGICLSFAMWGLLFAPRDIPSGTENDEPTAAPVATLEDGPVDSSPENASPTALTVSTVLLDRTVLIFGVLWVTMAITRGILNGKPITSAINRQFGQDSWLLRLVQIGNVISVVAGVSWGYFTEYWMGGAFLMTFLTGWITLIGLAMETRASVILAVMAFFMMRATIYGCLFFFAPKVLKGGSMFVGTLSSVLTCTAGLTLLLSADHLIEWSNLTGAKDYRPMMQTAAMVYGGLTPLAFYWAIALFPKAVKRNESLAV